jgi:hypothetical protein
MTVDEDFVAVARRGRSPEKRFRFAAPCVEDRCVQWTGSRCGVIDTVLTADGLPEARGTAGRSRCPIRSSCRWFAQSGLDACAVCPVVVTDCR